MSHPRPNRETRPLVAIILISLLAIAPQLAADEPVDWTRLVPGEVGFYAELQSLAQVRVELTRRGVWSVVRELADPPTENAATQPWQQRARQILGLDPEIAVTELLGHRSAMVATSSNRWQSGIVLAEMADPSLLGSWLRRWRARGLPAEGPVERFELAGGILLARRGPLLIFGPAGDPEGLWSRTVLLTAGRRGPNLRDRSDFEGLRRRMSRSYPGWLYVTWPEGDPTAFLGCDRLLVGTEVGGDGITCELRGRRAGGSTVEPDIDPRRAAMLPASTHVAWMGMADFAALAGGPRTLDERANFLRIFLNVFIGAGEDSRSVIEGLGPQYAIVVSAERSTDEFGLDLPTVAALCKLREGGDDLMARLDLVVGFFAQLVSSLATGQAQPTQASEIRRETIEGVELRSVDFGRVMADRLDIHFLRRVQLCWAKLDDHLLVGSSRWQARQIILAARGKVRCLDNRSRSRRLLPRAADGPPIAEWVYLDSKAAAQTLDNWLIHVLAKHPEALETAWWRKWVMQRWAHRARLGIGLVDDPEQPGRALVRELDGGSPAADVLRFGDVVVAAAGKPLPEEGAARFVAEQFNHRGSARTFTLTVQRDGERIDLAIPVLPTEPFDLERFDPIRALTHIRAIIQPVDALAVWRHATGANRYDARVSIRWRPGSAQAGKRVKP